MTVKYIFGVGQIMMGRLSHQVDVLGPFNSDGSVNFSLGSIRLYRAAGKSVSVSSFASWMISLMMFTKSSVVFLVTVKMRLFAFEIGPKPLSAICARV